MLRTLLGTVALVLPTTWLGYTYLPRRLEEKTQHNPGFTTGSWIGLMVLAVYLTAFIYTSGFDFIQWRRFSNVYFLPTVGFPLIIFPNHATRASRHYSTFIEIGMFGFLRIVGYILVIISAVIVGLRMHG